MTHSGGARKIDLLALSAGRGARAVGRVRIPDPGNTGGVFPNSVGTARLAAAAGRLVGGGPSRRADSAQVSNWP